MEKEQKKKDLDMKYTTSSVNHGGCGGSTGIY